MITTVEHYERQGNMEWNEERDPQNGLRNSRSYQVR